MLAAASPARDGLPALFQLALQIVSSGRELPRNLDDHLRIVIAQALDVIADPKGIGAETLPEALELAIDIGRSNELREAVQSTRSDHMTQTIAQNILALERKLEAAR